MSSTTSAVRPATFLLPPIDRQAFRDGARVMAPLGLAVGMWGLVTGLAMVNVGLSVPMALFMTITVYAGSAQLATLPLLAAGAPLPVVWVTALVVNLRFVVFSAASRRPWVHLPWQQRVWAGYYNGDLGFALFAQRFADVDEHGTPEQWGYFYGLNLTNWAAWQVASIAGIFVGGLAPTDWGLELAPYLALVAVLIPMANRAPAIAGTVVAAAVAVVTVNMPMRTGLLVAVTAGVAVAMAAEKWRSRGDEPGEAPAGPAHAGPEVEPA